MKTQSINIQITTVDEALHWQNVATLNINKFRSNPVEGQENYQSNLIRMWNDVHAQAGLALIAMQEVEVA
ncbi:MULTISPECIES: hypothetical protein [Vibrio]|uniref:hypothetical protein n=1 Tax=Vibrio TaxID=662 RepID=UPI000C824A1C|nr:MULTISPECIES: hypothetical protein [Vibrio]PMJ06058.1 hypothetical protein BCU31_03090 [Vibrio lentus]PML09518.1 hypothetical protein BCT85_16965 [Vibrio lentus]PMN13937.1 hypothetical protein BCT38_19415 [Vibrio lentus]PTP89570.1 hypothetical protein CWO03_08810 [Vibrio splendidus]PTP90474.1 hypothetical protein CWO02_14910 [Vibrio splendidus]